jgi:hypothetical protein
MTQPTGRRTATQYKRALVRLTHAVRGALTRLDLLMQQPATEARGRALAAICNDLDLANDAALHFDLGQSLRGIARDKARLRAALEARPHAG